MKTTYSILLAAAVAMTTASCEDWLDMPSESKADSQSIFNTIGRAELSVMGGYASLHTQELGYQFLEGTDECFSTESNSKYNVSNYDYTNLTAVLSSTYTTMYKAIEYANVCIKNIPSMSVADADKQKLDGLLGEALAMRAYAYWCIVRFYGDIPYADTPTQDHDTFASSRVSRDTIYDHCIADLQKAVTLLPWKSEGYAKTPERFTKNSAYGILARVALYAAGYSLRWDLSHVPYDKSTVRIAQRDDQTRVRQLYQIAADACKAVITRGENSLVSDYDQLYRDLANNRYNSETMLEYGWYGTNSADVRTGYTNGIPTGGTSNTIGKGGSQMAAFPTFYFEYDEGDQRRDVSVCNYGMNLSKTKDTYQMETFIGMGVGKYRINWKSERGSTDSKRDINWPMLRYSDVLLMYAEALNELNNGATAEAVDAVKQVRRRAFRGDETKIGQIPTAHDDFLNYIIKERKLELSNEGLRKSDLLRWGILYEHLTAAKQDIVDLANHEGKYANVEQYRAYKQQGNPQLNDPTIALKFVPMTEDDVLSLNPAEADLAKLHVLNSKANGNGSMKAKFYEAGGKVYFTRDQVPADAAKVEEVEYTIINMFGINSVKEKGNLCVKDVDGISTNNPWITGKTGVFYGLQKNMVEIVPLNTTAIMDVNPGLAGQQHPCYN